MEPGFPVLKRFTRIGLVLLLVGSVALGAVPTATGQIVGKVENPCSIPELQDVPPCDGSGPDPCEGGNCTDLLCEMVDCDPWVYCQPNCPEVPPDPCNYVGQFGPCPPNTNPCDYVGNVPPCGGGGIGDPVPTPECSDQRDNDGDGHVDYPDDPGCVADSDPSEKHPASGGQVSRTDATFNPECEGTLIVHYRASTSAGVTGVVPLEELTSGDGRSGAAPLIVEILDLFIPSAGGGERIEFEWDYHCVVNNVHWVAKGQDGFARHVAIEAKNAVGHYKPVGQPCKYDGVALSTCNAKWDSEKTFLHSDQGVDRYPHDGIPKTVEVCIEPNARGANYFVDRPVGNLIDPGTKSFGKNCESETIDWERKEVDY